MCGQILFSDLLAFYAHVFLLSYLNALPVKIPLVQIFILKYILIHHTNKIHLICCRRARNLRKTRCFWRVVCGATRSATPASKPAPAPAAPPPASQAHHPKTDSPTTKTTSEISAPNTCKYNQFLFS